MTRTKAMKRAITPSDLEDLFEEAAHTLRRLPNPPGSGPKGYGSAWPDYVQDARHAYGYASLPKSHQAAQTRRVQYPAARSTMNCMRRPERSRAMLSASIREAVRGRVSEARCGVTVTFGCAQ